jgi:ribosomal protein S18 acetylase RimI-like enzyme
MRGMGICRFSAGNFCCNTPGSPQERGDPMKPLLQEMTIADYEEVRSLWSESEGLDLSDADSRSSIERFLERNPGLSFVVREDGQLVGAVLCGHDGRRGYIDNLAVRASHRRQGIGRMLASRCVYQLIRIGISKWNLFVREDNQAAISFWRQLGWHQRVELLTLSNPGGEGG